MIFTIVHSVFVKLHKLVKCDRFLISTLDREGKRAQMMKGLPIVTQLYYSAPASIRDYYRLGGLSNRNLFPTVVEAGKSKIMVLDLVL